MFQRDYQFGIAHQEKLLPKLESFFNDNLVSTPNKFDPYDYVGNTSVYELKSRTNALRAYPTTCIGQDKINPNHTKQQVYLFNFTDGCYYINYDKELFDSFTVAPFRRYRVGVKDKEKPYVYIPIEHLKPVM
jgi:hypothetical protein